MHKSKNYDMATEVAMDKLMPKPIQITISMQGGGGLRGLGERPISSVYGRPIPRTIYRATGGYGDPSLGDPWASDEPDITSTPLSMTSDTFNMSDWNTYGGWGESADILGGSSPRTSKENLAEFYGDSGSDSTDTQDTQNTQGLLRVLSKELDPLRKVLGHPGMSKDGYFYTNRPRQEYAPKGQPQIQGISQTTGQTFQSLPSAQPTAPIDQRSTEVIVAQDFINTIVDSAPTSKNLPSSIDVEEVISRPGGVSGFFAAIDRGDFGVFGKDVADRNLHKGVAALKALQDVKRDEEYFRRKGGGGLSSVKKSININGQPHKLAWIRPDEASALKAMGGSGRKVEGIPAYDTNADMWSDYGENLGDPAISETAHSFASDTYDAPTYTDTTLDPGARGGQSFEDENVYTTTTTDKRVDQDQAGGFWQGVEKMQVSPTPRDDGEDSDYQQAKARVEKYEKWQNPYWNALKESGLTNDEVRAKLAGMGTKGLADMKKAYEEGYSFGGPMGTMAGISRDQGEVYAKKLKKLIEEDEDIRGQADMLATEEKEVEEAGLSGFANKVLNFLGSPSGLGKEPTSTTLSRMQAAAKEENAVFTPANRDPSVMGGIINLLTPSVGHLLKAVVGGKSIGTITKGGQTFDVLEDGSVAPIEYAPSNINEGPDPEPIRRRRREPPPPAPAAALEPEAPAKGTMAELLARRGATSKSGLQNLKKILASTHPGKDFNIG